MNNPSRFPGGNIRKITGGKDPVRIVEEFILRRGFDPDASMKERTPDNVRWMLAIEPDEELEILVEGLKKPSETTIYMGINVATIPIRGAGDLLAAALEVADGLVGIKVSLVGHYLVLSAGIGAAGATVDDLEYHFKLITAQQSWYRQALADELGWENLGEKS